MDGTAKQGRGWAGRAAGWPGGGAWQVIAAVILLWLLCVSSALAQAAEVRRTLVVSGPTLVAFVPPGLFVSNQEGAGEAAAHLQFAVADTLKCVPTVSPKVIWIDADVIVLRNGKETETLRVDKHEQDIGGVLVAPGRKARIVTSPVGPSALIQFLPEAAQAYWKPAGPGKGFVPWPECAG